MKIAWLTPFSQQSAIGQYSAIILHELTRHVEVTVFASDLINAQNAWWPDCDLRFIPTLKREALLAELATFDICVYNLGNNLAFHRDIYELSVQKPGIVILHDLVMHHMFLDYYLNYKLDGVGYTRALTYSHGQSGQALAAEVLKPGLEVPIWDTAVMLDYNMAKWATHGSYGVIVHSAFAKRIVEQFSNAPVVHLHFPTTPILGQSKSSATPIFGGDKRIHLITFGHINVNKKVAEVVEAIGQSSYLRSRVKYYVVGSVAPHYEERLNAAIDEYQLTREVELLGYQPDTVLHRLLAATDIVINLRDPHFGESSWSLLEAMTLGKPTIVWKHGFYDEFPDDTVAKVYSQQELQTTLEALCQDAERRQQIGQAAAAYARQTFNTESYRRAFLDFVQIVRYNQPALSLTDAMSTILLEMDANRSTTMLLNPVLQELTALLDTPANDLSAVPALPTQLTQNSMLPRYIPPVINPPLPPLPQGRLAETRHYYRHFPKDIAPYLSPISRQTRIVKSTRAGGLYNMIRKLLWQLRLDQTMERVLGVRLILTLRFFLSYPNVLDLYVFSTRTAPGQARRS